MIVENERMKTILPLLGAALAVILGGCVGGDVRIEWTPSGGWDVAGKDEKDYTARDYFNRGRYAEALSKARESRERGDAVDRPRWQLEEISNLLLMGNGNESHALMMSTREDVELLFDPQAERKAVSLWHGERAKVFKGDGWERATLYALLGLSFLERGDWESAMKCAKNGLLSDSDSQKASSNADYALLPYLGYVAARRAGAKNDAREFAAQYRNITGDEIPLAAREPDSLLVFWVGEGVNYRVDGEYAQRRKVVEGVIEGRLESVSVTASDGRTWFSLPSGIADLNAQATGRGPRQIDQVLENKVTSKETLANVGSVLLAASTAMMATGTADFRLAIVLYPTAAATALFAGGALVGADAVVATADTRIWSCLPGRLLVVPVCGGGGSMQLTGYMGWDEVYKGDVGVPVRNPAKISVCHKSLLPERLEIHAKWKRQVLDSVDELIKSMQLPENEKRMEIR